MASVRNSPVQDLQSAYRSEVAAVADALGADLRRGLTADEAAARLDRYGPNELPTPPADPAWRRFLAQFQNPLTVLLLFAAVFSFVAWLIEREEIVPYEALTILAIVVLNGVLGYVQEERAEHAVAALQAMSAATASVLRDGEAREVATREVVPGDLVLLEEGDSIPADGRVVESIALRVAEAALTGESTPVEKGADPVEQEATIGDQSSMVFSGTAVAAGRGRALVTATGAATQIGAIAGSLQETESPDTPLQRELDWVGLMLGIAEIIIAVINGATIVLVSDVRSLEGFVDVLLLAVSLAVAAVPEGLTAITTVVLSLGTQRMARRRMIVRKLAAVETLGSTTVICSDKTGTLTRNEMTVQGLWTPALGAFAVSGVGYEPMGGLLRDGAPVAELPDGIGDLLRAGALCNDASLAKADGQWRVSGDPTEGALLTAAVKLGQDVDALRANSVRLDALPFESENQFMATLNGEDGGRIFLKGAPEAILGRCTIAADGGRLDAAAVARQVDAMAAKGMRVLAFAARPAPGLGAIAMPDLENGFAFLGLQGMIDPPRPEAIEAIGRCHRAGITVKMITGDHKATAQAIAGELGILGHDPRVPPAIAGVELAEMSDRQIEDAAAACNVFARVAPEHKLKLVSALQKRGEIVA